jgi:hypothetical protein
MRHGVDLDTQHRENKAYEYPSMLAYLYPATTIINTSQGIMRFVSEPTTPTGHTGLTSGLGQGYTDSGRHHRRTETHPFMLSSRRKPRRLPLVFRFIKGAVHGAIIIPVICHAIFTACIIILDKYAFATVGLPSTIVRFHLRFLHRYDRMSNGGNMKRSRLCP